MNNNKFNKKKRKQRTLVDSEAAVDSPVPTADDTDNDNPIIKSIDNIIDSDSDDEYGTLTKIDPTANSDLINDYIDDELNLYSSEYNDDDIYNTNTSNQPIFNLNSLQLKSDADKRPLYVCPNGYIFLEVYNPLYRHATDFLIAIADPVTRPYYIHEYKVTPYSLYAAASLGLTTTDIIDGLNRLSKVELTTQLIELIRSKTERCGKVRLLLNQQHYYIESDEINVLDELLNDDYIYDARVDIKNRIESEKKLKQQKLLSQNDSVNINEPSNINDIQHQEKLDTDEKELEFIYDNTTGYLTQELDESESRLILPGTTHKQKVNVRAAMGIDDTNTFLDTVETNKKLYSFEIASECVEHIRKLCSTTLDYPLLEEYNFRSDNTTPDLPMSLKSSTLIREYQEKALSKMFGNGRARSGIIVLPCGAGKCFAAGSELMMYDGSSKLVEMIAVGDQLMGDDNTARTVQSLTSPNNIGQLYDITPADQSGSSPFTVNGEHIMVLVCQSVPCVKYNNRHGKWLMTYMSLNSANTPCTVNRWFNNETSANVGKPPYTPLYWYTTVNHYITYRSQSSNSANMAKLFKMYKPVDGVEYPASTTYKYTQLLCGVLDMVCNADTVLYSLWLLGLWLSNGSSTDPIIYQSHGSRCHTAVMNHLYQWKIYSHQPLTKTNNKLSTEDNMVFAFNMGTKFQQLLIALNMPNNKSAGVPDLLLLTTQQQRSALLAGMIDGDGYYQSHVSGNYRTVPHNSYKIHSKYKQLLVSIRQLARTIGLHVGSITEHNHGYRINISGAALHHLNKYIQLTYKHAAVLPDDERKKLLFNSWTFTVSPSRISYYYGFEVDGNRKFLLADCTVTHNVCTNTRLQ